MKVFSAEASADALRHAEADLAHGHVQDFDQGADEVEHAGVGRDDVQAAAGLGNGQRHPGFDGGVVHLLGVIGLLDDEVRLRQALGGVSAAHVQLVTDIGGEELRVQHGRVLRQGGVQVRYGGQGLIGDADGLCGRLRLLPGLGGYHRDAVAPVENPVLGQDPLILRLPAAEAVVRNVPAGDNRGHAGHSLGLADVDAQQLCMGIVAVAGLGNQQVGGKVIVPIAAGPGQLELGVLPGKPLADVRKVRVLHGLPSFPPRSP